jgi:hypothetical protein
LDAVTGQCASQIAATERGAIGAGETASFEVFVQGNGAMPLDPANRRIVVNSVTTTGSSAA